MRLLGPLLPMALLAACSSSAAFDGANANKADEVAPEDAPVLAESYGYVVTSTIVACSTNSGSDECKNDKRKNVAMTIRGLAGVTQDGARADLSISGCRIDVEWEGENYDDSEYFNKKDTLQKLGELARIEGVFVEGEAPVEEEEDVVPEGEEPVEGEDDVEIDAPKSIPILASGLSAFLIGAELSNPVEEDMPTHEDDARAIDQDNDRRPGVSLEAPIGKVYFGTRIVFNLPLVPAEDGSLNGSLEAAGFDFSVYDDSVPFVNVRKKAVEALGKLKVLSMDHQVTLVPGYAACAQVLEEL